MKIVLDYNWRKEAGNITYYYKPLLKQKFADQRIKQKKERAPHYTE